MENEAARKWAEANHLGFILVVSCEYGTRLSNSTPLSVRLTSLGRFFQRDTRRALRARQNPESEAARKKAEADRLRAAEKFMVVGTGEATCPGCGYEYRPKNGDSEYPVPPGTLFQARPPACCSTALCFKPRAAKFALCQAVAGSGE